MTSESVVWTLNVYQAIIKEMVEMQSVLKTREDQSKRRSDGTLYGKV